MADSGYIFGAAGLDLETRRLDELEALLDEYTFAHLRHVGIARGDRCLDIGAGRGTAALFMLSECGATGQVVATDIDTRWIENVAHPNLRVLRHDIVHDELDDLGLFDVVHARLLLHHLGRERGAAALSRMVGLLAPGGRLLVEEPAATNRADPAHPLSTVFESTVRRWYEYVATAVGLDVDFGLTLPRLLCEAGLLNVGNDVRGFLTRPGDLFNRWLNTSIESARVAVENAFDDNGQQFREVVNEPDLWSTQWLLVGAWGTRPSP